MTKEMHKVVNDYHARFPDCWGKPPLWRKKDFDKYHPEKYKMPMNYGEYSVHGLKKWILKNLQPEFRFPKHWKIKTPKKDWTGKISMHSYS